MKYAVTIEFCTTISIEADSPEEAERGASKTDITEVTDMVGDCTVVHVEEEND